MIAAVVVSDREDLYLPGCLDNLAKHLDLTVPVHVIDDRDHTLGMAGAVQAAWAWALEQDVDYLLHVEEDFRFHDLPLEPMRWILEKNPYLAQVVLKRQPVSSEEKAAGGQIETNPQAYTQKRAFGRNAWWVEHQTLFSLNPCLIPRRVLQIGWPSGPLGVGNESGMTARCVEQGLRFAYYGKIEDDPRCEHVGEKRGAGWRL